MRYIIITICMTIVCLSSIVPAVVHAQFDPRYQTYDGGGSGQLGPIVECDTAEDCDYDALMDALSNLKDAMLALAAIIATIIFAFAGITYLTANGNPGKINQAHKMFYTAIVGFFIAIAAWLLVEVFLNALGADSNVIRVNEFNLNRGAN